MSSAKRSSVSEQSRPPELIPPGSLQRDTSRSRKRPAFLIYLSMFALLIIGAAAVLIMLPGYMQNKPAATDSQKTSSVEAPGNPPEEGATSTTAIPDPMLNRITSSIEDFLSLKAQAESDNIGIWAPDEYKLILHSIEEADRSFHSLNYSEALHGYENAAVQLRTLLESESDIFNTAVSLGQRALTEEQSEEALRQFSRAMAITPDSPDAQHGLKRAGTLKTVRSRYEEALNYEQQHKYKDAEALLTDLLRIDPDYLPARNKLLDIRRVIKDQQFAEDLSIFYSSIENGNLVLARQALNSLLTSAGGNPEVLRAEELLIVEEESALINTLQDKAERQCQLEKWQEALATYKEVLAIAPDALFAVNGRDNAVKRIELDSAMKELLSQPQRLQDEATRDAAAKLLHYAQQFSPRGPQLSNQIDRLHEMLNFAQTPVEVVIDSDGLTEIIIYHVGRLGRFKSRQLILHPGEYTVVGSRVGFRDIRTTIEVTPDNPDNRFFIECKEPI